MNRKNNEEALLLLAEDLVNDLFSSSDEDIVAEAIKDFGSVEAALGNIRAEINVAIDSLAKNRLVEARAAVARDRESRSTKKNDLTETRRRISELLASGELRDRMTLAARNGEKNSANDLLSVFADLCELDGFKGKARKLEFGRSPKAEFILHDLGITDPKEIDVEAIAWHLGAKVKYDNLSQCEARIVGSDDTAVITVNKNASLQRQRFSVCHELGHWIYHRGKMLLCQADEIERPGIDSTNLERIADRFAAELLMPAYLFVPIAQSLGRPSMHVVRKLSEIFSTSQTATAIRLVEINQLPLLLVDHGRSGRRWFTRSKTVSRDWIPNSDLVPTSSTFSMIFGKTPNTMPPKSVSASNWFSRHDASRFDVIEESFRIAANDVLTLLAFKDVHAFLRHSQV